MNGNYGLPLEQILYKLRGRSNITEYEKNNDITFLSLELILSEDGVQFYKARKSDKTSTFIMVFKAGKNGNGWFYWVVSKEQARILIRDFERIYTKIDRENFEKRLDKLEEEE